METGIELITKERKRQIEKEQWTQAHDLGHKRDELARAAASYALPDRLRDKMKNGRPKLFPWTIEWWKPGNSESISGRIRELEKAGALIAAEIDRLLLTPTK